MWPYLKILPFGVFILFVAGWIAWQSHIRVPGDAAWLTHAASEILAGKTMSEAYFDNNPPLSFLIYAPAALLAEAGLKPWAALNVYVFSLAALAFLLTGLLLWRWPGLGDTQRWIMLGGFAGAATFMCVLETGQKDHLIGLFLFPFVLAQWLWTLKAPAKKLCLTAFILGTPFILIKPHYGLLCAALLLHRAVTQKRLSALIGPDTLCLGLGVAAYAALLFFMFPDFLQVVLPLSLSLYVGAPADETLKAVMLQKSGIALGLFLGCTAALFWNLAKPGEGLRQAGLFLSCMAALCLVPFFVQNKGFFLHLIPLFCFLLPLVPLLGALLLSDKMKIRNPPISSAFILVLMFLIVMSATKSNNKIAFHDDYAHSGLAQMLKNKAPKGFIVETPSTNVFYAVSLYADIPYATRFPSLWFLPPLARSYEADKKTATPIIRQFAAMIAEDIQDRKPDLLMIMAPQEPLGIMEPLIIPASAELQKALQAYKKDGNYEMNYLDFDVMERHIGPKRVLYDLYTRKD